MQNKPIIIAVIVFLVVAVASFYAGMKYDQSQRSGARGQFQNMEFGGRNGSGGQRSGGMVQGRNGMGRPVIGEVISSDANSITVKLPDGGSRIVVIPDSISVSKTEVGSKADIKTGERVGIFGTDNPDGTYTAQNVTLNPMFGMGRGGMGQVSPSASPK